MQNVDAPIGVESLPDHGFNLIGAGHIGMQGKTLAALCGDDVPGLFGRCWIEIHGHDLCAFARKEHSRGLAVTPSRSRGPRPGNEGYFVL